MRNIIVLIFLFPSSLFAAWSEAEQLCVFKKPLYVGASVTAATPKKFLIYNELMSLLLGAEYVEMGSNPGALVSYEYRKSVLSNKHASRAVLAKLPIERARNAAKLFTFSATDVGSYQVISMLSKDGSNRENYEWASIIFGLDLFYWDSIREFCGFAGGLINTIKAERVDVEYNIKRLIKSAYQDGKTLVLGTVPEDKAERVLVSHIKYTKDEYDIEYQIEDNIKNPWTGIPQSSVNIAKNTVSNGVWFEPEVNCVQSINYTIRSLCQAEKNCYIVDLHSLVKRLYAGEKIKLNSGKEYSLYELRPDGVHLSQYGSQLAKEEAIRAIEAHPPKCNN